MKHKPFFSVAIPAYGYNGKGGEFLDFNLKILSNQTFKDFEVVISDHSIDDTIKNTLKNCSGEYIKVLFQDDFLYNDDALKLQFDTLNSKPRIKWLITTFQHSNDGVTFYRLYHPRLSPNIWNGTNTLGNPSNLTILNEDLIYFDEELNWLVD